MKLPKRCRLCGCTQNRACLTAAGTPCAWVRDMNGELLDLCTACDEGLKALPTDAIARPRGRHAVPKDGAL